MMEDDFDYKTGEPAPVYGLKSKIESVCLSDALVDGISSALYY